MNLPLPSGAPAGTGRWALSFADLCLVLLAFVLLLQAHRGDPAALGASIRQAFGAPAPPSFEQAAAPLFESGEAVLLKDARARFSALGRRAADGRYFVHVASLGTDGRAPRFDAWELSAARAAAIARAIQSGGLEAGRIDVSIDGTGPAADGHGQHVRVTLVGKQG